MVATLRSLPRKRVHDRATADLGHPSQFGPHAALGGDERERLRDALGPHIGRGDPSSFAGEEQGGLPPYAARRAGDQHCLARQRARCGSPRAPVPAGAVQLVIAAAGEGAVRPRLDLIVLILQNNGDER